MFTCPLTSQTQLRGNLTSETVPTAQLKGSSLVSVPKTPWILLLYHTPHYILVISLHICLNHCTVWHPVRAMSLKRQIEVVLFGDLGNLLTIRERSLLYLLNKAVNNYVKQTRAVIDD